MLYMQPAVLLASYPIDQTGMGSYLLPTPPGQFVFQLQDVMTDAFGGQIIASNGVEFRHC
jgi:hypothetical protein